MRHLLLSLPALLALAGPSLGDEKGDATTSDRVRVVQFLKKNVIGRTVATPKMTFKLDDGRVEGESEGQVTFNNFAETAAGFAFDIVSVSTEIRYDLGADGKRVGKGRSIGGTNVDRFEFGERASTKKLTGFARTVSTTERLADAAGTATLVSGVALAGDKLSWTESVPGYTDLGAAGGKLKPGTVENKSAFTVKGGKLHWEYAVTRFNVDPDTLKRTPEKDALPVIIFDEIDRK